MILLWKSLVCVLCLRANATDVEHLPSTNELAQTQDRDSDLQALHLLCSPYNHSQHQRLQHVCMHIGWEEDSQMVEGPNTTALPKGRARTKAGLIGKGIFDTIISHKAHSLGFLSSRFLQLGFLWRKNDTKDNSFSFHVRVSWKSTAKGIWGQKWNWKARYLGPFIVDVWGWGQSPFVRSMNSFWVFLWARYWAWYRQDKTS